MKALKELLAYAAVVTIAIVIFGETVASGSSQPMPPMVDKLVYTVRVPASSPITP